ncbi:MAG TPA: RNA 2',3'-cyclic phosphodiesterase [Isosphaeraceae bacterium]
MPQMTRTFVAVPVPSKLGEKLAHLQSLLTEECPGVSWVPPVHFHLTLAFLGDVENTDLDAVCRAVAGASAAFGPLELRLEGLGTFPAPEKPRVFWVGLTGPDLPRLMDLQKAVAAAVKAAGYAPDDRFHPHVTLGRRKPGKGPPLDVRPQVRHYQKWAAGSMRVAEVVTFASTLSPAGPRYDPLARVVLEAATPPGPP